MFGVSMQLVGIKFLAFGEIVFHHILDLYAEFSFRFWLGHLKIDSAFG